MRTIILLLIALVLMGSLVTGCVSVSAPEKVEVQADAGKWNNVADKYATHYAGGGSRHSDKDNDYDDEEDDEDDD